MNIFASGPVLTTKRLNLSKDLMANFFDMSEGYRLSLIDLFDIIEGAGQTEGLRILLALDQLEIYGEAIHTKFEEAGRNVHKLAGTLEKELEARSSK